VTEQVGGVLGWWKEILIVVGPVVVAYAQARWNRVAKAKEDAEVARAGADGGTFERMQKLNDELQQERDIARKALTDFQEAKSAEIAGLALRIESQGQRLHAIQSRLDLVTRQRDTMARRVNRLPSLTTEQKAEITSDWAALPQRRSDDGAAA
jgi:uncharacterized protein YhaN